jgi:hypothetical protein
MDMLSIPDYSSDELSQSSISSLEDNRPPFRSNCPEWASDDLAYSFLIQILEPETKINLVDIFVPVGAAFPLGSDSITDRYSMRLNYEEIRR